MQLFIYHKKENLSICSHTVETSSILKNLINFRYRTVNVVVTSNQFPVFTFSSDRWQDYISYLAVEHGIQTLYPMNNNYKHVRLFLTIIIAPSCCYELLVVQEQ